MIYILDVFTLRSGQSLIYSLLQMV